MNPGKLNRYVVLKGLQTIQDEGGGVQEVHVAKKNCWAYMRVIRAYGEMLANRDMNVCLLEVTVRDDCREDLAPHRGDIVEWSGRVFDVESVSPPENGYVVMICREES
ncbi:MAG: head-tail adaptor protein [Synergistaceae bacterium]|nr:head-tail adaptor protein [Synergistaceae bacterium]